MTLHGRTVLYAGLEPLIDGTPADRIINGSTYNDDLVLEDADALNPGFMRVRSQAGDFYDAISATFTASLIFALVIAATVRWIVPDLAPVRLVALGVGWTLATVAFEFGFGRFRQSYKIGGVVLPHGFRFNTFS